MGCNVWYDGRAVIGEPAKNESVTEAVRVLGIIATCMRHDPTPMPKTTKCIF